MMKITVNDIPPSNNEYMGNSHNFNEYRGQKVRWHWLIKAALQKAEKPKKPLSQAVVKITYYFKNKKRRDLDNYSGKFLLDPLVAEGIIVDDSFCYVKKLELEAFVDKENPRTEIEVIELEG